MTTLLIQTGMHISNLNISKQQKRQFQYISLHNKVNQNLFRNQNGNN